MDSNLRKRAAQQRFSAPAVIAGAAGQADIHGH
ncbi:MAG: hypothetical protein ACD_34C00077G0001, partial [uncultured bacterium]